MVMAGKYRKKRKRSAAKIILSVVLMAVLLGALAVYIYADRMLGLIQRPVDQEETLSSEQIQEIENQTDPVDESFTGSVIDSTDVIWSEESVEIIQEEYITNILLIGQDRRPGQGRQRSDAMILCSINEKTNTITMTSFLRDLYVRIPGYQDNRLNAPYALGGMELLKQTLLTNFGVVVDGCVEVDFSQFERIVDLMGGVDIELTSAEAAHLNGGGFALTTGMNHLDGKAALAYSRIRYIGTDFGRTNRQRTVLVALLEQSRGMSLTKAHSLLENVLGMVTTDMSNRQLLQLVSDCFPMLSDLQVKTQYVPAEGTYQFASIRGMSVIVADMEANKQMLIDTIKQ
jgi:LCP family protein required for cell wall assembly